MNSPLKTLLVASAIAVAAPLAQAGTITLTLTRTTLTNVNDAAGIWQHQGGDVIKGTSKIGQYLITRRVTTGGSTSPLNTAATTITLFLATASGSAPQNITIQGAHDFSAGNFRGSVSAASNRYNWIQGGDVTYSSAVSPSLSLTIAWTGASQLTLP